MAEFLVTIDWSPLYALPNEIRDEVVQNERDTGLALIEAGTIKNIWELPGEKRNVGIWSANDARDLLNTLEALPIFPYVRMEVQALATHPLITNDYSFISGRSVSHT